MELHELHVAHDGAGAKGDGVAVGGGDGGVCRLPENLPRAAGGKNGLLRPEDGLAVALVPDDRPPADSVPGQQVDDERPLPEPGVGQAAGTGNQGPHHFFAGGVPQGMRHAAMAVPTFLRQRQFAVFGIEDRSPVDQFLDPLGRLADDHFHNFFVAQPLPGRDRVSGVAREIIDRIEHAGDASLGVGAVRLRQNIFADHDHLQRRLDFERRPQSGDAASHDQLVGKDVRNSLRMNANQVAMRRDNVEPGHDSSDELDLHRFGDDAGFVSFAQQRLDRRASPRSEIERPVVHVHFHKRVRPLAIEVAAVFFGIRQGLLPMVEPVLNTLLQEIGHLAHGDRPQIAADGIAPQREREPCLGEPPLPQIDDQVETLVLKRELTFVNYQSGVGLPGGDDIQNLIEGMHFIAERIAEQKLEGQKRRRQRPRHGDPFAFEAGDVSGLASHHHRAVIIAHAGPARTQSVLVGDERIAVQADRRQFELTSKGPVVERLDVLQGVMKSIPAGIDLIVGQGMKHECVVRVGTVPDPDQSLTGSDCGHKGNFGLRIFNCGFRTKFFRV